MSLDFNKMTAGHYVALAHHHADAFAWTPTGSYSVTEVRPGLWSLEFQGTLSVLDQPIEIARFHRLADAKVRADEHSAHRINVLRRQGVEGLARAVAMGHA